MHPALSIIVFTTLSGAGYGLLFMVGLAVPAGLIAPEPGLGVAVIGVALVLVIAGLLSSTFHLGHPERAWRALSQWRSSWLSREGVMALLTFIPTLVFAYGWLAHGAVTGPWGLAGLIMALMSVATLWSTAMIYCSLKTIARWHSGWTPAIFLSAAFATGNLILTLIVTAAGANWAAIDVFKIIALIALVLAGLVRVEGWRSLDRKAPASNAGSATGLGGFGHVRALEPPHTAPNYVQREMAFQIARKHADKLRRLTVALAYGVPFVLVLLSLVLPPVLDIIACLLAVASGYGGVLIERWLFFAEATHKVTLYYGAEVA